MILEPEEIYDGIMSGEVTLSEFKAWLKLARPRTAKDRAALASAYGVLIQPARRPYVPTFTIITTGSGLSETDTLENEGG
jgi:hypothetical protein